MAAARARIEKLEQDYSLIRLEVEGIDGASSLKQIEDIKRMERFLGEEIFVSRSEGVYYFRFWVLRGEQERCSVIMA